MRRIHTRREREKKEKRGKIIIGALSGFILILSIAGFSLVGNTENSAQQKVLNYHGYKFFSQNTRWFLNYNGNLFSFKDRPNQIINLEIKNITYLIDYYNKPLYIYSQNSYATSEIYLNFNNITQRIQPACLDNCSENVPIKTCEDNFILIENSKNTSITRKNNCIFIKGENNKLPKLTESFILKLLRIN